MAGKPIRIEFQRSGGFAGISMTSALDTRELSPGQARQVEEMVERLDLGAINSLAGPGMAEGADRFYYRLVIAKGDERVEVSLSESAVTEELRPVVEKMTELARQS